MKYNHKTTEQKWQKIWEEKGVFHAEENSDKEKFYALIEFPYPSGQGLHVGHPRPTQRLIQLQESADFRATMCFILSAGTHSDFLPKTTLSKTTFTLRLLQRTILLALKADSVARYFL